MGGSGSVGTPRLDGSLVGNAMTRFRGGGSEKTSVLKLKPAKFLCQIFQKKCVCGISPIRGIIYRVGTSPKQSNLHGTITNPTRAETAT